MFFKTDAPDGSNLYACANSGWVMMGLPALSTAGPPGTCAAGSLYLQSDTAHNIQQLYVCSNTNTWTMASARSGLAANRPANCVVGQTWLSTDAATMTYCSAAGNPGTWSATLAGPSGPIGPQGPQGPTGATGSQGAVGPAGPQGPTGATGSQGTAGAAGAQGPTGAQGPAGPIAGSNGQFTYNSSGTAAGGNLSQNADGSLTANKGFNPQLCTVTLSASPVFDASQCNTFTLTLGSTPVAGSTLSNAKAGQSLTFILIQDATGGRSFVWPTNVQRACTVTATAGASTVVTAVYDGVNANATNCTTGDTPTLISGPTRTAPATPAAGLACWFDSTDNTLKCKDAGGNVYAAPLTTTATAHQFVSYIDSHGVQQKAQPADADLSLTDVATNNVSASSHGFAPKLPNDATKYLNGAGAYSVPAGGGAAIGFFGLATASSSAFSATPAFSLADVSAKSPARFEPGAMTANVTGVTFTNKTAGAKFSVVWLQDGTGGRTVTYGASASNACQPSPTSNIATTQEFEVSADGTTVNGTGCTTTDTAMLMQGPTRSAPATPPGGTLACWYDSTDNTQKCKDSSANVYSLPLTTTATSHQWITSIDSHGVQNKAQPADADLSVTDVTTNNVSTSAHGFAPKLPNDATKFLDGTGNYSAPAGSGGGSATWPASMVYFPGTIFAPGTYGNSSPTAATTYCTDVYDPYTIVVSTLATIGGAASKYQAIAVFDSSGNQLISVNAAESSGSNWNKFTLGSPVTLNPGLHSWCTAWETGASPSAYMATFSYANWLNPGTSGAGRHNYTCNVGQTGASSTFAIAANGNCATLGTKTSVSVLNPGIVTVLVNP